MRKVIAFFCVISFVENAYAFAIFLDDFSGSETVISFSGISVPNTTDPISIGDLTIDSSVSELVIGADEYGVWPETPLASGGNHLANRSITATNIVINFVEPINRFGLWINGGNQATSWTFRAFDEFGQFVGSHLFDYHLFDGYPDPSTFAGIEFSTKYLSVSITESNDNGQYTSIDDIRYESVVPEPSSALIYGLCVAIIVLYFRNNNNANKTVDTTP